jgi:glycosyltransferase involved in cell wall biosynthesis
MITIPLNAERFLDQPMQNVPRQRFTDFDLILLDEGSTDGGTAIARGYVGFHIERARILGKPTARLDAP